MNSANLATEHIGELTLRRRRAGEALGPEGPAIDAHATSCADCRARIRALDDEQRRFEQEISFDRFAAGVERAERGASRARRPIRARVWISSLGAMAAAAAALIIFVGPTRSPNRIKGDGGGIIVRVAGTNGQRTADGRRNRAGCSIPVDRDTTAQTAVIGSASVGAQR